MQRDSEREQALDALEALPWEGRAIMLMDLDAFFASVEQLDHPAWRGKPVIVGGSPQKRGVVSTASYEARAYGVHSAMPSSTAASLCPDAIWTSGSYARYREMSNKVMGILHDETPFIQQVSIDEAFCDITPTSVNREHPVAVARRIQGRVEELGITCSIGLGTTKSVAKLASDMDKPCGLTVVYPGSEQSFMAPLPIRALSGIGGAAEKKLIAMGIETLGDLAKADDEAVVGSLGKNGRVMLDRARCVEEAAIDEDDEVKSVSNETSFATDISERSDVEAAIATMAAKVGRRLRRHGLAGSTLALKVRYENRSVRTAQCRLEEPSDDENVFMPKLIDLLDELWSPGVSLRLVGVAVSHFDDEKAAEQLSLLDDVSNSKDEDSARRLALATDAVRTRFGDAAVSYGRELRTRANTTGTAAKNPEDYKN